MRGVLAAEDRAGLGHHLLDEQVPDPRADRHAAVLADDLGHGLRADEVVDDRLAGMLLEDPLGHDGGGGRAADGLARVVDEEDAIRVAVEREADVGAAVDDGALEVLQVLDLDRVGRVVREGPVELGEEDREVERQAVEHLGDDEPTHPVRRVGDDRERQQHVPVDEALHVPGELVEQVDGLHLAGRPRPGASRRRRPSP